MEKAFASTVAGQAELFRSAVQDNARADETFLHLVSHGMTKSDLRRSIELRPALWQRYEHWLPKLPDERP